MEILLNAGADVNAKGRINNTPLHYGQSYLLNFNSFCICICKSCVNGCCIGTGEAVINGDRNLVKQLLVAGADATQVNLKGKNARDLCLASVEDPTK